MTVGIKGVLCTAMKASLQKACMDDVPADDPSRAGLVVLGRYTASVTTKKIVVEVHPQHPLGPERQDRRGSQGDIQREGYEWTLPAETIGGVRFRWDRGTVQIRYHLRMDREEAVGVIQVTAERVKKALTSDESLIGLVDDFGNRIHALEVTDDYSYTNEAGDPATERLFVDWRALISSRRTRA